MAARKKKAVEVDTGEVAGQTAAVDTGEAVVQTAEDAETVTVTEQTDVPSDVASAQALAFPYNRTLKFGADGEDVLALQTALLASGLDVSVSGVYDLRTVRAVQQLQRQKGQSASGIIGKHDYAALLGSE